MNTDGNIIANHNKKLSKNVNLDCSNGLNNPNKNYKYKIFNNYTSKPKHLSEINNSNIKKFFINRVERKNITNKHCKKAKTFSLLEYSKNNPSTNLENSNILNNDIDNYDSTNLNFTSNFPHFIERKKSNNISVNINSSSESNFGNVRNLFSYVNSCSKNKTRQEVIKKNNSISNINNDKKEKDFNKDINPIKNLLINKIDEKIETFKNKLSPKKSKNKFNINSNENIKIVTKNKITGFVDNSKILIKRNIFSSNSQALLNIFNKRPFSKPSGTIVKKSIKDGLYK